MQSDNSTVTIGGQTYQFYNRINSRPELLTSFNQLAQQTFEIQFQSVGAEYEPHVLTDGDTVCANVSVNQIPFYDHGERKFYIQLGTVMTRETYRKRGLGRWLIETIIEEWQNKCDAIYLFANDSVLEFYPKFGFEKQMEFEYSWKQPSGATYSCQKLSMDDAKNVSFVFQKYQESNHFSALCMIENRSIMDFYVTGVFSDHIYYLKEQDLIVFAKFEVGKVHCYDIFGKTNAELADILPLLKRNAEDEVVLGFTPKDCQNLLCRERKEKNTTLFVRQCAEKPFALGKSMFPLISHA